MGIYLEFQFSAEAITNPKVIHWRVMLQRTGQDLTSASGYYQVDRSQILKRGMEMMVKDVGTLVKRINYVRIPKSFQRMKANQKIEFNYQSTSSQTVNACGFAIYKEYK